MPSPRQVTDLLATGARRADLDTAGGVLGVFVRGHQVEFGRADVGVTGELLHLV